MCICMCTVCCVVECKVRHYIQCATTSSSSFFSPHDPIPASYIYVSRPLSLCRCASRPVDNPGPSLRLDASHRKREYGSRTAHPNIVKQLDSHSLSLRVLHMGNHMSCSPSINLSLSAFSKSAPSALVRYLGSSFFLVSLSLSSSP